MAVLTHPGQRRPCRVCGGPCTAFPDIDHLSTYPFLPGGRDPMAGKPYVIAPHRVVDHELGRVMYGTGDQVPIDQAIRYGLVDAPPADPPPGRPKGKRRPTEDRARRPAEDRA